jgi:hypothetical protein
MFFTIITLREERAYDGFAILMRKQYNWITTTLLAT